MNLINHKVNFYLFLLLSVLFALLEQLQCRRPLMHKKRGVKWTTNFLSFGKIDSRRMSFAELKHKERGEETAGSAEQHYP